MQSHTQTHFFSLKILISFLLFLTGYFIILAVISKSSLRDVTHQLTTGYYFPFTNSCTVGKLHGVHIHLHLMLVLAVFCALYGFRALILGPSPGTRTSRAVTDIMATAGLGLLLFVISLQTFNHTKVFANERRIFSGISTADKQSFIHRTPYEFAQYCRQKFPGRHKGFLRTDHDINAEPFMTRHRKLAYFLYPDIDIKNTRDARPYDCLIFYEETTGSNAIPTGFTIQGYFDSRHFLAVKKQ